jgi:hypothetical protein
MVVAGVVGIASAVLLGACSVIGLRSGTEEPSFEVVDRFGAVEVRRYGPRLAAETLVDGPEDSARNAGFRALAGFIFGANRPASRIAMTAPVAQERAAQERTAPEPAGPERIAMTAPVAQQAAAADRFHIRFFMPASFTRETLPVPSDPAVRIVEIPPATVAIRRFSGRPTPDAVAARRAELMAALDASPWQASGPDEAWFYDPPWTLPPARRNEVAVPVTRR